jgi:hypothetical protein
MVIDDHREWTFALRRITASRNIAGGFRSHNLSSALKIFRSRTLSSFLEHYSLVPLQAISPFRG